MLSDIRWAVRPSNLMPAGFLQDAPPCRELRDVRPSIAPWGNAMRLQLDHEIEVAAITGHAIRAVGL